MNIKIIGFNHKTAPIGIREKLSFPKACLDEALSSLKKNSDIQEGVILSTCNRIEIYALARDDKKINGALSGFLEKFHNINMKDFKNHSYEFEDMAAIRHLFRVSSSLDSQILGENQILGQVKAAFFSARNIGAVSRIFSFLFEEAIKIGKRARTQTQIGYGAVSISTAAVEMARKIFEDLSDKKILIIGAGKIGELSANHLKGRGAQMVLVANRTFSKAQELAKKFNGQAVEFDKFPQTLIQSDIVISSVSAPHVLVKQSMMSEIMIKRKNRPIFFIDLGLPRNIDPDVNKLENVYVYNLDDLEKVKDANLNERLKEAKKIEDLIEQQLLKVQIKLKKILNVSNLKKIE
ncbi:MAG: glutamyl-tRNA reductase [Candidatus Omnitrophica bacterium]|nr:glutamyl-tRNA reductase [Candidatus Omnitrophota bacterium]